MKCPKCEAEFPDNARFCGVCGQSLKGERVWPQCGQVNPQDFQFCLQCGRALAEPVPAPVSLVRTSFGNSCYQVKRLLDESSKKKVYLVHDTLIDRVLTFALIKTEKPSDTTGICITGEGRVMGRLCDHPNIVAIYDTGDHEGQAYIVVLVMPVGREVVPMTS